MTAAARKLYLLAFDHRDVFTPVVGTDDPAVIGEAKLLLYDAFREVAGRDGTPERSLGILVDERYGAAAAQRAVQDGTLVCMPAELSGRDVFEYEFGDAWREHVERFDPHYVKVLVRHHPDGDPRGNALQLERLAGLSEWLRATGRSLLFELLVPPAPGEAGPGFASDVRPGLVRRAMAEIQDHDIDVDVWKLEGIDRAGDAEAVVAQARRDGRDHVVCTVLGAGADDATIRRWLSVARDVEGFAGFAIGRSIWADAIRRHRAGELDRDDAVRRIADGYADLVELYERGTVATGAR